jgi:hypothetical protein
MYVCTFIFMYIHMSKSSIPTLILIGSEMNIKSNRFDCQLNNSKGVQDIFAQNYG